MSEMRPLLVQEPNEWPIWQGRGGEPERACEEVGGDLAECEDLSAPG